MGIPYSREINAAFEQVTPLVGAGYQVLRTMKDISILLAVIQVLTVLSLIMILFVLILLLYSVNPDLEVRRISGSSSVILLSREFYMSRQGNHETHTDHTSASAKPS
jgi:hypothetical protein